MFGISNLTECGLRLQVQRLILRCVGQATKDRRFLSPLITHSTKP